MEPRSSFAEMRLLVLSLRLINIIGGLLIGVLTKGPRRSDRRKILHDVDHRRRITGPNSRPDHFNSRRYAIVTRSSSGDDTHTGTEIVQQLTTEFSARLHFIISDWTL
jgi:hypothetical protein